VREGRATTIGDGGHARKARNETKHDSKADVVRSVRGMERDGRVVGRILEDDGTERWRLADGRLEPSPQISLQVHHHRRHR